MKTFLRWSILLCGLSDYSLSAEVAQLAPGPELRRARPAEAVAALVARGRGQYLAGEPAAAQNTLEQALAADPSNAEAQFFINRLHRESAGPSGARAQTSAAMLGAVDRAWQRPSARREAEGTVAASTGPSPL